MKEKNIYLTLFKETFTLSAFTFGGGYVIISLMKKKFVDELEWLSDDEMLNLTAIAQSSPGPVAVNAAIILGYKLAGINGALVSILGTILPPLFIITAISYFYEAFKTNPIVSAVLKGMQSGVAAVIADVVYNLGSKIVKSKDLISCLIMAAAFFATFFFQLNVIYIILICGCIGAIRVFVLDKIRKAER